MCVCVCVCIYIERERDREREQKNQIIKSRTYQDQNPQFWYHCGHQRICYSGLSPDGWFLAHVCGPSLPQFDETNAMQILCQNDYMTQKLGGASLNHNKER